MNDLEKEIEFPEGSLVFDEKESGLRLTRVTGNFSILTVPDIKSVSKKAFLGKHFQANSISKTY